MKAKMHLILLLALYFEILLFSIPIKSQTLSSYEISTICKSQLNQVFDLSRKVKLRKKEAENISNDIILLGEKLNSAGVSFAEKQNIKNEISNSTQILKTKKTQIYQFKAALEASSSRLKSRCPEVIEE